MTTPPTPTPIDPARFSDVDDAHRLSRAAMASYARAFGSRAVEAAESDWIGRALKSIKRLSDCLAYEVHLPTDGGENRIAVSEARALLAETETAK